MIKKKRNKNQNKKKIKTVEFTFNESHYQSCLKKFPFVSQYDFIHFKCNCKKAEVEVFLRNEKIKQDYCMSFKEGLGKKYIIPLVYSRANMKS